MGGGEGGFGGFVLFREGGELFLEGLDLEEEGGFRGEGFLGGFKPFELEVGEGEGVGLEEGFVVVG